MVGFVSGTWDILTLSEASTAIRGGCCLLEERRRRGDVIRGSSRERCVLYSASTRATTAFRRELEKGEREVQAKRELIELCDLAKLNGTAADDVLRGRIKDAVLRLERIQEEEMPDLKPATDDIKLIDGDWTLLYTSTRESSSGKVGPLVGRVMQRIDVASGRFFNQNFLGPATFTLDAKWKSLDDRRFKVLFQGIELTLFGALPVFQKAFPEGSSGIWRMGYISSDLRVLWTKRSEQDKRDESIFILRKEIRPQLSG